jgi:hypothetical protein
MACSPRSLFRARATAIAAICVAEGLDGSALTALWSASTDVLTALVSLGKSLVIGSGPRVLFISGQRAQPACSVKNVVTASCVARGSSTCGTCPQSSSR